VIDDGGGGTDDNGLTFENGTVLSSIYGEENGVAKRIVPTKNNILVGSNGKFQKRLAGQMRYPAAVSTIHNFSQSAAAKTWTITLPGKPSIPDEVDNFAVELIIARDFLFHPFGSLPAEGPGSEGVRFLHRCTITSRNLKSSLARSPTMSSTAFKSASSSFRPLLYSEILTIKFRAKGLC
jgi:hypothetical protein